jgi:hypothetical protein
MKARHGSRTSQSAPRRAIAHARHAPHRNPNDSVARVGVARDRFTALQRGTPACHSQFFKYSIVNGNTLPASCSQRGTMKLIVLSIGLLALVLGARAAHAERWDSTGWVKLGAREVNGRVDQHCFKEGQRTRAIDLPGDDRVIKFVGLRYRDLPGGGRAKAQVWAK